MTGNKKKDFQKIISCWFSVFLLLGMWMYLQSNGKIDKQFGIMLIISIFFIMMIGIWGIITYRKQYGENKYSRASRQKKKIEERNRMFQKKMKRKSIYEACQIYMREYDLEKSIVIAILFLAMGFMFWVMRLERGGRFEVLETIIVFLGFPIAGGLICFFDSRSLNGSVKLLENEIKMKGYDLERINEDFKGGTKCCLFKGLLHIGANYVILCHEETSFVRDVRDVCRVEKQIYDKIVDTQYGNMVVNEYYIIIYTTKNKIRVKCMGESEADWIVEEFAKHGIYDMSI